jgi:uncharacterized protein (DUF2141 family)
MTADATCTIRKNAGSWYANLSHSRQNRMALTVSLAFITAFAMGTAMADSTQGDLIIHATGFADDSGQAVANLFSKGENVLEKPKTHVAVKILNGTATMTFAQVPYGSYAVTVYHDKNSNGEIDHNFMHMPAEPLGFSNGFKLSLFSGLPSYDKLHFEFSADSKPLEIIVR